jgi:carbon dioxide concentrating mechanism protein CcmO
VNIKEQVAEIEVLRLPDLTKLPTKIAEELWNDE